MGFLFSDTRIRGIPVPFHRTFEEVNLRFYVRRVTPEGDVRRAVVSGPPSELEQGSEAEFITEHYWGYTRQRDGGTIEYRVDHPRWRVWSPAEFGYVAPDDSDLYPARFARILAGTPRSAFVAEGSAVTVFAGERLT